MKERVVNFGPNQALNGIVTEPENSSARTAPTVVLLNAGIVHRVGPFRLNVDLARHLATLGVRSLRFDLSGLGESRIRAGKMSSHERAKLDVSDAFTFLEKKYGAEGFVLMGLCSGAFNAHQVAICDPRVKGAVFFDGIAFPTFGYKLHRNLFRFLEPRFWRNYLKRRRSSEATACTAGDELAEQEFFGTDLDRKQVKGEVRSLLERGTQLFFVYTEGYAEMVSQAQFEAMFGLAVNGQDLSFKYYNEADHTFRLTQNRVRAVEDVGAWFKARFA